MRDDLVTQLREMVARSLALAQRTREEGHHDLSAELIAQAIRCEEKANTLEAMNAKPKLSG